LLDATPAALFGALASPFINTLQVSITHMAVAPITQLRFTPPPNDVHGITKSGLKAALLSVLAYTGYDAFVDLNAVADAGSGAKIPCCG
jgi:hypothetical protein